MNCHFLSVTEKTSLLAQVKEQFGITALPEVLLETGKEKIRGFSGSLTQEELKELGDIVNVEIIGIYLIRKEHDLRLSFDATHFLASQLDKNIVEINEEQRDAWIRGNDLELVAQKGTVILRHNNDLLGCGKSTGEKVINHVPKERRLRSKTIK